MEVKQEEIASLKEKLRQNTNTNKELLKEISTSKSENSGLISEIEYLKAEISRFESELSKRKAVEDQLLILNREISNEKITMLFLNFFIREKKKGLFIFI